MPELTTWQVPGRPPSLELGDGGHHRVLQRPFLIFALAAATGLTVALLVVETGGLGKTLGATAAAAAWFGAAYVCRRRIETGELLLVCVILAISAMFAVRSSVPLLFANLAACLLLALLLTYVASGRRLLDVTVGDYILAPVGTFGSAFIQPLLYLRTDIRFAAESELDDDTRARRRHVRNISVGVLLAAPVLFVFGLLFASADAIFADYVGAVTRWHIPNLGLTLLVACGVGWFTLALTRTAVEGLPDMTLVQRPERSLLGGLEATTFLSLIVALFAAFVAIQATYLFGGLETLQRTGLTYSEYARRGFFELVAVTALVVGVILVVDWLTRAPGTKPPRQVIALQAALILLTLVVAASALVRMSLYVEEFGLTRLRFYPTAFMFWVVFLLLWMAFTVLRGKRTMFATGAFASAFFVLFAVNVANPDGFIARVNINRVAETGTEHRELDVSFLADHLSTDAVPILVDRLGEIPDACARGRLAEALLAERETLAAKPDSILRWNLGDARARGALESHFAELQEYAATSGCPRLEPTF